MGQLCSVNFASLRAKPVIRIYAAVQTMLVGQSEPGSDRQDQVVYDNMDHRTRTKKTAPYSVKAACRKVKTTRQKM